MKTDRFIIVRGAGDLATGTIHRLWSAGFFVMALETGRPAAIRRKAALSEAVYDGRAKVENMKGVRVFAPNEAWPVMSAGCVPVLVDSEGASISELKPAVVVDAILAKKNTGTNRAMAPLTIALGSGFAAGDDVDAVIETMRGHNLGRIIIEGSALPNTGVPGSIRGYAAERVIHAPSAGTIQTIRRIGDLVEKGETLAWIRNGQEKIAVGATLDGVLRGLIRSGYPVSKGLKIADIDPRKEERGNCFTISDKARCIGGSVLELVVKHMCRMERGE